MQRILTNNILHFLNKWRTFEELSSIIETKNGFVFALKFRNTHNMPLKNKCIIFYLFVSLANTFDSQAQNYLDLTPTNIYKDSIKEHNNDLLFDSLHLGKLGLGRRPYDYAMLGYHVLKAKGMLNNDRIISIADMSSPSGRKRFFVLDIKNYKLLFVTYVAHGKNSGLDKSLYFSNEPESNKSSVGFYITSSTYSGGHGYSMRLEGQEIGFNNKAKERDIVVHSADYVNESVVKSQGYIGRSLGCPALSPEMYKPIIDKIKNGSCLFIYGNDSKYITNSRLLKRKVKLQQH